MFKYYCKNCNAKKNLEKATLEISDGKVRTREAQCECGEYMIEVEKEFGVPYLIRTEPTLTKK
tara:strand:- start:1623 stop:1811 length:189 start_codon:yes stop_codon:yes gene_type:complete